MGLFCDHKNFWLSKTVRNVSISDISARIHNTVCNIETVGHVLKNTHKMDLGLRLMVEKLLLSPL